MKLCALVLALCTAGCGNWLTTSKRTLIGMHAGADATRHVSSYVYHSRCMKVAAQCEVAPPACASLKACHADRAKFNSALTMVYRALNAARALVEAAAVAKVPGTFRDKVLAVVLKVVTEYRALMALADSMGVQ